MLGRSITATALKVIIGAMKSATITAAAMTQRAQKTFPSQRPSVFSQLLVRAFWYLLLNFNVYKSVTETKPVIIYDLASFEKMLHFIFSLTFFPI